MVTMQTLYHDGGFSAMGISTKSSRGLRKHFLRDSKNDARTLSDLFALFFLTSGAAPPDGDVSPPLYYSIERDGTLYARPDRTAPLPDFRPLACRSRSHAGCARRWLHVRTMDDVTGFVPEESVSNVWLRISKKRQMLFAYRGTELALRVPVDLALNAIMDKEQRGGPLEPDHWRTPEGSFHIVAKNPDSKFYKALLLNYPLVEDAERGIRSGLITEEEYQAIVEAEETIGVPR